MGVELLPIAHSRVSPLAGAGGLSARAAFGRDGRGQESWSWCWYRAYPLLPPSWTSALSLYESAGVEPPPPLVDVLA